MNNNSTTKTASNPRKTTAKIIQQWLRTKDFSNILIPDNIADRSFVTEVVYGVIRWKRLLNWYLRQLVHGTPDKSSLPFLWVGLYQIMFMDTVADHAAVNETVEAIKDTNARKTAFVNAVLREALRRKTELKEKSQNLPLAIRLSHPDLLVQRWGKRFGSKKTESLCKWNNIPALVTIHPAVNRISTSEFTEKLKQVGIIPKPHPFYPDLFLELPHGIKIHDLPGYLDGLFSIQDPSTMMAIDLLNPKPGDTVLDACAAPGGKTILIAERLANTGKLIAMDFDNNRLKILNENVKRMKIPAELICADATKAKLIFKGISFNKILADVPCTNTGVIRRRPDARWNFSIQHMEKIIKMQNAILDSLADLVASNGSLVYSTCSIEAEENILLIRKWCARHHNFKLIKFVSNIPPANSMDGVFAALLQKYG